MPDYDVVGVMQADTSRKPSTSIWRGCPWKDIPPNGFGRSGVALFDDFTTMSVAGANASVSQYKVVGTTGTVALVSTTDGGLVQLKPAATADNEAYLVWGQALGSMGQILSNTNNQLWFECRVKLLDITNGAFFFGLAKPTDVASGFLTAATAGVLASTVNAVGFNLAGATPTKVDIVHAKGAAPTVLKAAVATATTSAFLKLGFRFGGQGDGNKVRFFVDGTEIGTNVVSTAANFPSSIQLTPVFACHQMITAGTGNMCNIDWWRAALLIEDPTQGVA